MYYTQQPYAAAGEKGAANRNYKSTIFAMLFGDRKRLLKLYNAISGKNYTAPEDLEINTLENAVYLGMKNDLSFLIDERLSLYEHQSTVNPNMPLRFLFYISDLYSGMLKRDKKVFMEKGHWPSPFLSLLFSIMECFLSRIIRF